MVGGQLFPTRPIGWLPGQGGMQRGWLDRLAHPGHDRELLVELYMRVDQLQKVITTIERAISACARVFGHMRVGTGHNGPVNGAAMEGDIRQGTCAVWRTILAAPTSIRG